MLGTTAADSARSARDRESDIVKASVSRHKDIVAIFEDDRVGIDERVVSELGAVRRC